MGGIIVAWVLGSSAVAAPPEEPAFNRYEFTQPVMAVPVRIVLYAADETAATRAAEAAFDRIRQLNGVFSDYDPQSELRQLCDTAGEGKAVAVSDDLWQILCRAREFSERSGGAFDVTVGPVVRLWRRARLLHRLPTGPRFDEARGLVDFRLVRLDPEKRTVELLKPGMRLDLGGIAKGYAGDAALAVLEKAGIRRALIDAGGDIVLGDPPADKPGWRIGIARLEADGPPSRYLWLSRRAIATSGDTWQFVEIDGRRYSHIVDPRTGLGLTDHSNVSVVAPDGTTADALASAVSVLGPEKGLALVDATPGAAALIVRAPSGTLETFESKRWKQLESADGR